MRIIAHRGWSAAYPENTMAAFTGAVRQGVSWLETDVDLAKCGTPMLLHDDTLDRTTTGSGPLWEKTAAELAELDAGSWKTGAFRGEKIPTLAQLLGLAAETGTNLNLELKSGAWGKAHGERLIHAVLEQLAQRQPGGEILISSFNHLLLQQFIAAAASYDLSFGVGLLYEAGGLSSSWRYTAELLGATAIHPCIKGLQASQVAEILAFGLEVNVWTVNELAEIDWCEAQGVTSIFTDHAGDLLLRSRLKA